MLALRSREHLEYNLPARAGDFVDPQTRSLKVAVTFFQRDGENIANAIPSQCRRPICRPRLPVPVPNRTNSPLCLAGNGDAERSRFGDGEGLASRSRGHSSDVSAAARKTLQADADRESRKGVMPEGPEYASALGLLWGMTPHSERLLASLSGGGKGRRHEQKSEEIMPDEADGDAYRAALVAANERRQRGTATAEDWKLINTARARHGLRPLEQGDAA